MNRKQPFKYNIYTKKNIAKFFDPFVFNNLNDICLDSVNRIKLVLVFWDISYFSDFCQEQKENDAIIMYLLRNFYDLSSRIIKDHNGIIDKFIGDGIFAYFGYQISDLNQAAYDAVHAALMLREEFRQIKKNSVNELLKIDGTVSKVPIDLKCAIHVGEVLFGCWKSVYRTQITSVGDEVNFCSRLEGISKKDQIIVSTKFNNIITKKFKTERFVLPAKLQTHDRVKYAYRVISVK